MPSPKARVTAAIAADDAVNAICDLVDARDFDPRQWSLWTAERLERAARQIREGIADARASQLCRACDSTRRIDGEIPCPECNGTSRGNGGKETLDRIAASPLGQFLAAHGKRAYADYGWGNARSLAKELGWVPPDAGDRAAAGLDAGREGSHAGD